MSNKAILIASSSLDSETWQPVAARLRQAGNEVIIYEADEVARGKHRLEMSVNTKGELQCEYKGRRLSSATISAAWYRRPSLFGPEMPDAARQLSLDHERRLTQENIWSLLPSSVWLNSPHNLALAERKLVQIATAKQLGFITPRTVVSTTWGPVKRLPADFLVFKMPQGILRTKSGDKATYTTILKNGPTLTANTIPFPGYWQPYIPKKREWRVTVVGAKVFAATIYTTADAKDDWRKYQDTEKVRFQAATFPESLQHLCQRFLRHFGLRYGAFDFIETPTGEIVFLECNPNGQYGWLEDELHFPISTAIAQELLAIAETNTTRRSDPKTR